jgi:hypothetical protein
MSHESIFSEKFIAAPKLPEATKVAPMSASKMSANVFTFKSITF